jgi:transcriptional regulator with GAF, ATPase, and Fis domain
MMIGISKALEKIDHRIEKVAMWDEIALIQGEIGTGKELVAHAIHLLSARQGQPLITVNCAALPRELAESSLFGHVKGAFTGATHDRKGCFEEADGGTIFLDEIGELDLKIQAKLLRVVETGELQKVGESSPRERVDVRILAATSRDLKQMAREGTFNEALLSRLDALRIQLPPLRERREDIPHLVTYFLRKFASTTLSIRCNLLIFRDCISGYNRLGHSLIRCNLLKNNTLVGCSDPNASMPPAEIDKVVLGVNRH